MRGQIASPEGSADNILQPDTDKRQVQQKNNRIYLKWLTGAKGYAIIAPSPEERRKLMKINRNEMMAMMMRMPMYMCMRCCACPSMSFHH